MRTSLKEHQTSDYSKVESAEEEANFARNIKKVSRKYKGKFPFKCFNYGEVGHFVAKCPYKGKNKEEDSSSKNTKRERLKR